MVHKKELLEFAVKIGNTNSVGIELIESLMTKSKEELLTSLHNTDNPKFIGIINDTIRARFPE